MISEEQLAAWERLCNEATPGPWAYDEDNEEITSQSRVDADLVGIATLETDYNGIVGKEQKANLDFIIEAREALPLLIAEVRRLQPYAPVGQEFDWGNGDD